MLFDYIYYSEQAGFVKMLLTALQDEYSVLRNDGISARRVQ